MPQSLTRLPKTAHILHRGMYIRIKDHEVIKTCHRDPGDIIDWVAEQARVPDLFNWLATLSCNGNWTDVVAQMEQQGINYEMVIEHCVTALENTPGVLGTYIYNHYKITGDLIACVNFSKSAAGRRTSDELVVRIRNCNNWRELFTEMSLKNKSYGSLRKLIKKDMKKFIPPNLFSRILDGMLLREVKQ